MKFEMNDIIFTIRKVSQDELFGDAGKESTKSSNYFGRFRPYDAEIWISKDLPVQQVRKTLIHELTHCYKFCYVCDFESLDEEDLCELSAASHDIIHKIVEEYFKKEECFA